MRIIMILLALLFSEGVSAQRANVEVRIDLALGVVHGLPQNEKIEYSGMTAEGNCFVITRPNVSSNDWDTQSYTGLYDGKCTGVLRPWGAQKPRKSRDGRIAFEYNLHPTPGGPFKEDFDVILMSVLVKVPSKYKNVLLIDGNTKKFKKADED